MSAAAFAGRAPVTLTDLHPRPDDIAADAVAGLSRTPKHLPSKYFYDAEGSRLFEAITRQPEYYPTRTELALLDARMPAIAQAIGPGAHVVEYGSGSGRKTERLLEGLIDPVAYTPVEISRTAVLEATERLAGRFPQLEMLPVCGDFTRPLQLPQARRHARRMLMFFPGSTIGNFTDAEAVRLLDAMRRSMGRDGAALIGIDLVKDPALIEAAYNDAAGVTERFTLNLLERLNREVGSDFDVDAFAHRAVYVRERERIETALVSRRAQTVHLAGRGFRFEEGEAMLVEYSQKYSDDHFAELAAIAGLRVTHGWNDPRDWMGLRLLRPS
ncbi:L-histidine N(alpha)-methyltransferase [[Pseudomonas] boreopolis]|uniref:Dimethylhistidine N-methyltransferase n=1 Tax=Xanthomonas boreopolis TaxID=86183 RepID=A0A919FBC5_9XANT|nr:dimethylhistidine N-methyltransferase [[Pseudomonas] boreopolis]